MVYHLFPFTEVEKDSKVILYGAGLVMSQYIEQIRALSYCDILFTVDRNYTEISEKSGIKVLSPAKILVTEFDYLILSVSEVYRAEVLDDIRKLGAFTHKIISSEYLIDTHDRQTTAEALVVMGIFDTLGIKNPSYMDVGACHPFRGSNTELFYSHGCRGINIEANPNLLTAFHEYRPQDINLNAGIGAKPGLMKFYLCNNIYRSSFKEEMIRKAMKTHPEKNLSITGMIDIPVKTLNSIIQEYNQDIFPDFLDLDIEGMDKEVLAGCDFSKHSPLIICVEITSDQMPELNKILAGKKTEYGEGYFFYCRINANTIYLRSDIFKRVLSL